jgi:hypothetical protein
METPRPVIAFVVRVIASDGGRLKGTVERVRTGEKHHFDGIESVSRLIEQMARTQAEDSIPLSP